MIDKLKLISNNIFLDNISHEEWNNYNEKLFIENFFLELIEILGHNFYLYEFYIFSSTTDAIPNSFFTKNQFLKVLIYISQESGVDPAYLSGNYFAIFKCYLKSKPLKNNIFNFPIGYVSGVPALPIKPILERDIDVFFVGNLNKNRLSFYRSLHPLFRILPFFLVNLFFILSKVFLFRFLFYKKFFKIPNLRSYIFFTNSFKSGFSLQEYAEFLSNSKFVVCPKGFVNIETFRHYEAMRSGSIVVSENLPPSPLYDGAPYILLNSFDSLENIIKSLLSNPEALSRLQQDSLRWYDSVLSEKATAIFVASSLKSLSQ